MRSLSIAAMAMGVLVFAGCDADDTDGDAAGRAVEVYTLVLRDVLASQPPPEDPDVLPVMYVMGVGEEEIAPRVQAEIADLLREEADIRFADDRKEAVIADDEGRPVRDKGVLVVLSVIPDKVLTGNGNTPAFELEVELYRSEAEGSARVLTIGGSSPDWTVTSSTVVEA